MLRLFEGGLELATRRDFQAASLVHTRCRPGWQAPVDLFRGGSGEETPEARPIATRRRKNHCRCMLCIARLALKGANEVGETQANLDLDIVFT